jgi:hypothetical protein
VDLSRLTAKPSTGPLPGGFALVRFYEGPMPTDLGVASERKRKATQAQTQSAITILLVCVIIILIMLGLLFLDQSFSNATIEFMGRLPP